MKNMPCIPFTEKQKKDLPKTIVIGKLMVVLYLSMGAFISFISFFESDCSLWWWVGITMTFILYTYIPTDWCTKTVYRLFIISLLGSFSSLLAHCISIILLFNAHGFSYLIIPMFLFVICFLIVDIFNHRENYHYYKNLVAKSIVKTEPCEFNLFYFLTTKVKKIDVSWEGLFDNIYLVLFFVYILFGFFSGHPVITAKKMSDQGLILMIMGYSFLYFYLPMKLLSSELIKLYAIITFDKNK